MCMWLFNDYINHVSTENMTNLTMTVFSNIFSCRCLFCVINSSYGLWPNDFNPRCLWTHWRFVCDSLMMDRIGCVMVSVLDSCAVDRGFEPRSGHTKVYKIGIYCFSTKHAVLRSIRKDWLARNQNNVSEWNDISTLQCCFSELALLKSNSACWSSIKRTSSSFHWKYTSSRHDIAEKLPNWC